MDDSSARSLKSIAPCFELKSCFWGNEQQYHQSSTDVAVRCLALSTIHQNAALLRAEVLIPIVHTEVLERTPVNEPMDILNDSLICHSTWPKLWNEFFNEIIGEGPWENILHYQHSLEHFFMSLEAVKQKQRIALVPDFLVNGLLEGNSEYGELCNPLGLRYESHYGYYFLTPAYRRQDLMIKKLLDWFQVGLQNEMVDVGQSQHH